MICQITSTKTALNKTVTMLVAVVLACILPCTAVANEDLALLQDLTKMITDPDPDAQVEALFSKYPDLGTLPKSPYGLRTPINTVLDHCISPTAGVCSSATIRRVVDAGGDVNDMIDSPMATSILGTALTFQSVYGGKRAELFEATNKRIKDSTEALTTGAGVAAPPKPATNAELLEAVKTILVLGADPNSKGLGDIPLLYTAVDLGPEFAIAMMEAGADKAETIALLEADIANSRRVQSAIDGR